MNPLKRLKKALNRNRQVTYQICILDGWTNTYNWRSPLYTDVSEAIAVAFEKQPPSNIMDGSSLSCKVRYQTGDSSYSTLFGDIDFLKEIQEYMETK